MLFGEQAALLDRSLVARDDQLGFLGIEDIGRGQPGGILAAAIEDGFGAAVGEQVSPVADALDDQRHRNVVDHQFQELLGVLQFARQRAAFGDVVEQRDQELGLAMLVARNHPVGGENSFLRTTLDGEFAAMITLGRLQRRLIRDVDAFRGFGPEDLVGALADDMIAREPREALERAVGEDIAAVLDVLGGDADRNVVEHRFQELRGRGQLARQLALLGAVLMGSDRAAVRQPEDLREHRFSARHFGDKAFGAARQLGEFLDGDIQQAARAPQLDQVAAGLAGCDIGARKSVDIEKAVVTEDDAALRVGHHHALVEVVQGGTDEGVAPQFGALRLAQRAHHPDSDRTDKRHDDDAADQEFPDHVGIERADIACRRKAAGRRRAPCQFARHGDGEQAQRGQRRNRILPACLPILASHHSPADLRAECPAWPVWIG